VSFTRHITTRVDYQVTLGILRIANYGIDSDGRRYLEAGNA
jgi:hypothetical protein